MRACNNAELPGTRKPFLIGDQTVGWVPAPDRRGAARICRGSAVCRIGCVLDDPAALPAIARALADMGYYRWRGEAFDVRARPEGPVLAQIDRGALPSFGIQAAGVHVNGLVQPARRAASVGRSAGQGQAAGPGKLDHIVAGGVPAGLGPTETLIKEAAEEAAIPPELAAAAVQVGVIEYAMERPRGTAARHSVLLRPGAAGGFRARGGRRRGRGVRTMADRTRGRDRARRPTTSSSTSIWC